MTRRYLVAAVAVGVGSTVCLVLQAVLIARVAAGVLLDHRTLAGVGTDLVLLGAAFAGRAACGWAGEVAAHRTSAAVTSALRRQVLTAAVRRGPGWLAGERTGEVAAAATRGVDALDTYFSRYLPTAVLAALTPAALLAFVLWADPLSFLILVVTVAVVPLFMVLLGLEARGGAERQWSRLTALSATFLDVLAGLPTLRAFGRTADGRATLARADDEYRRATTGTLRLAFLSSLALEVLSSVGTALVALFLGLRLLDGRIGLSAALAVLIVAPEVYLPVRRAGAEFHAAAEGQAAADRILDVLDEAEADDGPGAAPGPAGRPAPPSARSHPLVLDGVTVRYPGRAGPVLDAVDLVVAPGEHVAVTGVSGAGKSTLLHVVLGFVDPAAGRVRLGDRDLAGCDPAAWRRQVAWVPQRPYLVRGTLATNLALGDPAADRAALTDAARRAGLGGLLDHLPLGLDTPVGEGGLALSTGERQRVAIARAVLRDAAVVLLDEPTASLDAAREHELSAALAGWLDGRTVLVAAHRRGLVGRIDRTVALVDGRLVEGARTGVPA